VNREAWKRLEPLADQVLELDPAARPGFIADLRTRDPGLCRELEAFLALEGAARDFMTGPVERRAPALMGAIGEESRSWDELQLEGEKVGPYRLVREIGRGGMGTVFLAERADGQFDQQVALKLVKLGMGSAETLERFRSERQILARLQHAHIARLLDGGVSGTGQPYFAMENVEGEPITGYCDRRRLPREDRLRLFLQVCEAVEYAHRSLVVHRDLKPSNVLVTGDGQAKLLDFGIAKVLDDTAGEGSVTRGEVRAMTPRYAAPEQMLGQPVTTATDVYSLGVVLYELLSGRYPYRVAGPAPADVERAVLQAEPEPLFGMGDLDNVLRMALRKEPERRYGSVRAFAEDLRRHLEGLPVSARADTLGYRAGKFVRRHRLGVAAAAVVLVSLAAGVAATLWQAREALRQARRAEEMTRFTLSLFEVSDPDASKGKEITARQLLEQGTRRIEKELGGQPELEAQMLLVMGDIQHRLGLQSESRPLFERALLVRRRLYGDEHPAVAEAEVALGESLLEDGELDQAAELTAHALRTREKRLGRDHADTALARGRLGRIRFEKGDLSAAESLLVEAVAVQRRQLPASEADLATNLNALGRVLHARADWSGAERLYGEALRIRQKAFGDEHTTVAESLFNIAALRQDQGDLGGAEKYYRQVLALERKLLGDTHDRIAADLNNLATVLNFAGGHAEAEALLREALEIGRRLHGPEGPQLAVGMHNLARALRPQGKLREAEALSREALRRAVAMLGEEHVNVAAVREGLARTLGDGGQFAEAEQLARRALATYRKELPADHPRISEGLLTLGRVLAAARREGEAEPLLRQAFLLRQARFGGADWRTAEARRALSEARPRSTARQTPAGP
jgi:serine/threonine-protein kinase